MAAVLYRCPDTGLNVQGWFADDGATSEGGSRSWHNLLPDPLGASPPWSRIFGALRSREAADTAIKAAKVRAARSKQRKRKNKLG